MSRSNDLDGRMTEEELYELPSFRYKGKEEQIEGLPNDDKETEDKKDNSVDGDNVSCRMCLFQFDNESHCRILKCLHIFHKECIDPWLST